MKKIAIVQSNYIPWKGYFDLIASVDEFILYDDMQFTRRDWRNRNQIKTPQGIQWLTVPVRVKGKYHQLIKDVEIDGCEWAKEHLRAFEINYKRTNFFQEIYSLIEPIYCRGAVKYLSDLNRDLIKNICNYLDIHTVITTSSDYKIIGGKTERLVDLCIKAGGCTYISGPSAMNYIDPDIFTRSNIALEWFNYDGYDRYPQLWGDFTHNVSILDLLFNAGRDSRKFMKFTNL